MALKHFDPLSLQANVLGTTTAGTFEWVTSPYAAFRVNPTTTGTGNINYNSPGAAGGNSTISNQLNIADAYYEFLFRPDTLPSADSEEIFVALNTTPAIKMTVRVNSAGELMAFQSDGTTQLGSSGSTVLVETTEYLIGVRVGTGASANWAVQINGVNEISGTGDLTAVNNGVCQLGKPNDRNGETVDFYYRKFRVDDTAFLGTSATMGYLLPVGDGVAQDWDSGTGTTFAEVDEVPPSDADYLMSTAADNQTAMLAMQDASVISAEGTIHAVMNVIRARENENGTSAVLNRLRSTATDSDATSRNFSATSSTAANIHTVDPATTAAWTTGGIDGCQVGAHTTTGNTIAVRMDAAYLLVAWTPAAPSGGWGPLLGMQRFRRVRAA